jgi:Protein of unknown function (DUF2809)
MSSRKKYIGLTLIIFGLEVLIATKLAHFKFIRENLGDFLVVPLIYFAIQAGRKMKPLPVSVGVFIFSCAVEVSQYFHLADALGFSQGGIFYILLGNYFSLMDLLMYFLGSVAAFLIDTWLFENRGSLRLVR